MNNFIASKDKDRVRLLKLKVSQPGTDEPHYGVVNLVEPKGLSIISVSALFMYFWGVLLLLLLFERGGEV